MAKNSHASKRADGVYEEWVGTGPSASVTVVAVAHKREIGVWGPLHTASEISAAREEARGMVAEVQARSTTAPRR